MKRELDPEFQNFLKEGVLRGFIQVPEGFQLHVDDHHKDGNLLTIKKVAIEIDPSREDVENPQPDSPAAGPEPKP